MGTSVTVTVAARDETRAAASIRRAFGAIERVDAGMSLRGASSEVRALNEHAGGPAVVVSEDLASVLLASLDVAAASSGAFDPTIGSVSRLWDFENGGRVPGSRELAEGTALVGWKNIQISEDGREVGLLLRGSSLDLGGVAKGYAIDAAINSLVADGVTAAMIDAGGDLRVIGGGPGRKTWRIGVQDPGDPGRLIAKLDLSGVAVATSGDYERFFEKDGVRYHHLLDPATGRPARGCRSVTVVAPTAVEADACATAAFVLGPDRGLAFLRSRDGVSGLIVEQGGAVRWSDQSMNMRSM